MRNILAFLFVFSILFTCGCQQSAESKSPGSERQEKLLAAENMNTKAELEKTQKELEKQKQLLMQAQKENAVISKKAALDANEVAIMRTNYSNVNKDLVKAEKQIEDCNNKIEAYKKMIDDKDIPGLCKTKVDRIKAQLAQCEKEKKEIEKANAESSDFFMKQLPESLKTLTTENEQLKAKIAELEKQVQNPPQSPAK